jgi:hypothetical protein
LFKKATSYRSGFFVFSAISCELQTSCEKSPFKKLREYLLTLREIYTKVDPSGIATF